MQPNHIFEVGSLTKQFTAVAILLLAQDGVLSLDDNISKYIPDISTTKGDVTLKHLLAHTSGLVDPINTARLLEHSNSRKCFVRRTHCPVQKSVHWQHVSRSTGTITAMLDTVCLPWVIEKSQWRHIRNVILIKNEFLHR